MAGYMEDEIVTLDNTTALAAYRLVYWDGSSLQYCAANGANPAIGTTLKDSPALGKCPVVLLGDCFRQIEASEAIAAGAAFAYDADGKARAFSGGRVHAGTAITAATSTDLEFTGFPTGTGNVALAAEVTVLEAALTDTGTITLDAIVATNTITVQGTALTFRVSGTAAGDVLIGAGDTEAATNLAAKIATISGIASATANAKVVTVTGNPAVVLALTSATATRIVAAYTATNIMALKHT